MVSTTIKYIVYTHDGGGVRHHHFGVQNNIIDEADGHATAGDILNALGFATQIFNGASVPFAFMSVTGGVGGNQLYTSPGNHTVVVGTDNVDILVVYAPPGGIGGPGGQPGIWVDAFNVDTGAFSDSLDFIKVLTPPTPPDNVDAAKTTFGNQDGTVVTVTAENVRANHHVDGIPFKEWKRITQTQIIQNSMDLHFAQNQTGEIWFAFYQSSGDPGIKIPHLHEYLEGGMMMWTGDDYCGNGGHRVPVHGPGPAPFKLALPNDFVASLSRDQQARLKALAAEYPALAQAAFSAMNQLLVNLKSVSDIASKGKGH
jgi:hypothetical protein